MYALTRRECEILHLLRYQRCRQIAETLAISELTVRKHRANICAKLGLSSTAALIAHAMQQLPHQPPSVQLVLTAPPLTPREREIADALACGLTSKHIARQLGISPRTVEKHRENSMRKLDVHGMRELLHCLQPADGQQSDTTQSEVFSSLVAGGKVDVGR